MDVIAYNVCILIFFGCSHIGNKPNPADVPPRYAATAKITISKAFILVMFTNIEFNFNFTIFH